MLAHNSLVVRQQRLNLPTNIPLHFAAMWQMAAEGQSGRMASGMEVHRKQRCVTEFLREEKRAPTDIPWWLLNVYGDEIVDVSTVRLWVVHFSTGDSESPLLVQIFMSTACRLLFIAGKNVYLMVVTVSKNVFCSWEFALSHSVIVLFVAAIISMEIIRRHYFRSNNAFATQDNSSSLNAVQASQKLGHPWPSSSYR